MFLCACSAFRFRQHTLTADIEIANMTMSNETVYICKLLDEAHFNKRAFTKRQMNSKFCISSDETIKYSLLPGTICTGCRNNPFFKIHTCFIYKIFALPTNNTLNMHSSICQHYQLVDVGQYFKRRRILQTEPATPVAWA